MTVAAGAKPQEKRQEANQHQPERRVDLGGRYGAIGIASVAAAARYSSEAKSQAYPPAVYRIEDRFIEAAAN